MIVAGMSLALVAAAVLIMTLLTGSVAAGLIFIPMGVLTFGRGLVQPNAQSGAVSGLSSSKGTASGVMGFMQLTLASCTSQLMPSLLEIGVIYVFIAISFLLVAAAVSHRVACRSGRLGW